MRTSRQLSLVVALLLVSALGTEVLAQQAGVVIRVRGADSMARRIELLSQQYMKIHPDVNVVVSGGSKESAGLEELLDNHAEVAMAGRQVFAEETEQARNKGITLVERLVGYGGIVIVTHPDNTIGELTVAQVQEILTGQTSDWEKVGGTKGPITVVTVGDSQGGSVVFLERSFLSGRPITKAAKRVDRFPAAIRTVAQTPGALGYVRVRDALESDVAKEVRVKIISIKKDADSPGVMPSRSSIGSGTYPLRRPFFLYHDEMATDEVKKFIDFILSKGWGPQSL